VQDEATTPLSDDTETMTLTFVNDLHIEPDYTKKADKYKKDQKKNLKLVKFHQKADAGTQAVLAATIKEAVDLYDTSDSRYMGTGSDRTDDLIMKWGAFE
jgi:hypothetical protein